MWLEHVSLRSLRRASQLQRTKHDTSADPRRAFCCHQCFKKPQDNICLSPPFYRFFYFLEEKTKNCSCFISEHAWNKYDTFKGITNTKKAQLMRGNDQYFCLRLCLATEKGVDLFSLHGKHEQCSLNISCSNYISNKMNKGGARVCHKSRSPE